MNYIFHTVIVIVITAIFIMGCNNPDDPLINGVDSDWFTQISGVNNNLKSVQFLDSYNGYAIGSSFPNDTGKFLWTSNSGQTWYKGGVVARDTNMTGLFFFNLFLGIAIGNHGKIAKTYNGGLNWVSVVSGTTNFLTSIVFTDINTGFVSGYLGTVLKTTTAGNSWQTQSVPTSQDLFYITNSSSQELYAVGVAGTILYSNDGGSFWFFRDSSAFTNNLTCIKFVNNLTGFTSGMNGTILKTTNKGISWAVQTSGTSEWLHSLFFISETTGIAVGDGGVILRTTNGGSNWDMVQSPTGNFLRSVYFFDSYSGWAVGENGTIIHTTSGIY